MERFRSPITLPRMRSGPLPWDERTGCFAIRQKVLRPAPLYTPWWRVRRQMGLSRSPISSMCWYSFRTLGSPHLMKNWKPSCPGHPISSKTIKFQIPMHTQSAISTNERQTSNTRPAVLGTTGRSLSAYEEKVIRIRTRSKVVYLAPSLYVRPVSARSIG